MLAPTPPSTDRDGQPSPQPPSPPTARDWEFDDARTRDGGDNSVKGVIDYGSSTVLVYIGQVECIGDDRVMSGNIYDFNAGVAGDGESTGDGLLRHRDLPSRGNFRATFQVHHEELEAVFLFGGRRSLSSQHF